MPYTRSCSFVVSYAFVNTVHSCSQPAVYKEVYLPSGRPPIDRPARTQASTSEIMNFQSRPTLWAGSPFRSIHLWMVSGLTPRCAAISATDSHRSFIFDTPAEFDRLSDGLYRANEDGFYQVCPIQPAKTCNTTKTRQPPAWS